MANQAKKINSLLTEIANAFFNKGIEIMDLFVKNGENADDVWDTTMKITRNESYIWIYRNTKAKSIEDLIHFFKNSSFSEIKDAWDVLLKKEQEQYAIYTSNPRVGELKEVLLYLEYGVESFEEAVTDEELEKIEEM